jgi:thiamine kinase-like enzyme
MDEARDPQLEDAIRSVPAWQGHDIEVTPIAAGITNRNFLISTGDERFVLRLAGRDTDLLGIDREAEVEAGRAASAAGVGPEIVVWMPERSCLVTRFVLGEPIPEDDLQRHEILGHVIRSVRAIHASAPIRSTFPVFRIVEDYARVATEHGVEVPGSYDEAHAVADRIEVAFSRAPMPLTTCHDDLLNANFLLDGEHVWIVDYEYAGMGDPFFDLGNLSVNNGLGPDAQEALLGHYFGEVHDTHRARLALMRLVSDFREAMWGVVQQGISTLDVNYVDYASRHFARLLAGAEDDRLGAWLDAAGAPI